MQTQVGRTSINAGCKSQAEEKEGSKCLGHMSDRAQVIPGCGSVYYSPHSLYHPWPEIWTTSPSFLVYDVSPLKCTQVFKSELLLGPTMEPFFLSVGGSRAYLKCSLVTNFAHSGLALSLITCVMLTSSLTLFKPLFPHC